MPLVYPVKIKYKDKLIVGLISPHLRIDFITKYIDSTIDSSSTTITSTTEHLEIERLQIVMEDYVKWLQDNNYILRIPGHSQIKSFEPNEQWINIQINVHIEKGSLEHLSKTFGILLFLSTATLGEFFFVMAARFNKVSYAELILPILADFTMAAVIYVYSGTAANVAIKGKQLDDWWNNKNFSPTEIDLDESYPLFSSTSLSKLMLCTLPLVYTIFKYIGYWQSMMSMRDEVEASNLDDQVISPKFIYNLAIVGTTIGSMYTIAQCTSLSLQATNILKTFLDDCYDACREKLNYLTRKNYAEISTTDEEIEDGVKSNKIEETDTDPQISVSSFNVVRQAERDDEIPETYPTFFLTEISYNNLLINKQGLLYEVMQIAGIKAVSDIINLGEDTDIASAIIEAIEQYGIKHVVNILFDYTTKNPTPKYLAKEILQIKEATELTVEHIFFLDNDKGIDFIQAVANNFNQDDLLLVLELGKDQSIAEQILLEVEIQGIDEVLDILCNKQSQIDPVNHLENIIGIEELNKLQLIPQGILNLWSNKAYQKIVGYVDSLAKNLDDLLNMGKSGDQVTITLMILENFLEFAASDQRVIGSGRRPHYDPGDDHGSSYGADDDNNTSYVEDTEHQAGFTGLLLPLFNNSTDDNLHHYQ